MLLLPALAAHLEPLALMVTTVVTLSRTPTVCVSLHLLARDCSDGAKEDRGSFDEELATMSPDERVAYLKEYDDSDKSGEPKKGGLIEKLIARGNKRTEEQLEREHAERTAGQTNLAGAATTAGSNPVIR